jgi:Family of unknown function (DUF6998)
MYEELVELAKLIRTKNSVDGKIARIVGRPALIGHVGEFIAARVFGIELHRSASAKGSDGVFKTGSLAGKTVNVKWYTTSDNLLDLNPSGGADYYLVLAGPSTQGASSRGTERPWTIDSAYLFASADLIAKLRDRGVGIGVATSVRSEDWEAAEIYPQSKGIIQLDDEQRRLFGLFSVGDNQVELSK